MALAIKSQAESQDLYINPTKANSEFSSLPVVNDSFLHLKGNFSYENRLRLVYIVNEHFSQHFVLIRGLFEFYRSAQFSFKYSKMESTIEVTFQVGLHAQLADLTNFVFDLLQKEIEFKKSLKKVLEFENRTKLERERVYEALNNSLK